MILQRADSSKINCVALPHQDVGRVGGAAECELSIEFTLNTEKGQQGHGQLSLPLQISVFCCTTL